MFPQIRQQLSDKLNAMEIEDLKRLKKYIIKMSFLSVQRSVADSFNFRGKNVRSVHVTDAGQCLIAMDVSKAVGYNDDDNARRAIRTYVPGEVHDALRRR